MASSVLRLSLIGLIVFVITLSLFFLVSGTADPTLQPQNSLGSCKTLKSNGPGIGFVFFSSESIARDYMNSLLALSPYKEQKDALNFYYIDDYDPSADCTIYKGIALLCYNQKIIERAGACPYNYIVVPQKQDPAIRSSAYRGVASLNMNVDKVFGHEAGHLFGLGEEYLTNSAPPAGSRNCAASCDSFVTSDGCFKECSTATLSRSIKNGLMRTLSAKEYGKWDISLINEEINRVKSSSITGNAIISSCSDQSYYLLHVHYTGEELQVTSTELLNGCTPSQTGKDLSYELVTSSGTVIREHNLGTTSLFTDGPGTEDSMDGETYNPKNLIITFPYDPNAASINFYNSNNQPVGRSSLTSSDNQPCEQ